MATLEALLERLKTLGDDPKTGVDLGKPIREGAREWLRERFRHELERELPPELEAMLRLGDGIHINDVVLFSGGGAGSIVDHNLELRSPPSTWLPGQIAFGRLGNRATYVMDVDAGKCHVSELLNPRWQKSFGSFADLLLRILKEQVEPRVRDLS